MKILLLGGSGFIGRHAAAAFEAAGHEVLVLRIDFAHRLSAEDWAPYLSGIDAVVNAVGIFREACGRRFETLHDEAPRALFAACEKLGVSRVVQISALGADGEARSRFHRTKKRADDYLATRSLDWAIVQPSLVFGRGGASARLFALLASLPWVPLPGEGSQAVQPIHIDDLAEALAKLIESPGRRFLHAVGPRPITVRQWLALLRGQMGLGRARFLAVPRVLLPLQREAVEMLDRGNTASADAISRLLGRAPRAPEDFVVGNERDSLALQARLAWLLPLLRACVAAVWIGSGVVSLGAFPMEQSLALLTRVGLASPVVLYGAALLDIALGVAIYVVKKRRWLWRLQLALLIAYSVVLALWLPETWLHPFGPALKNLPMLAAIAVLHELDEKGPWTTW